MQRLWQVGTHSCASIVLCYILVPYKPDALAALGVVGGLSLPEVLHHATCTPGFSPPFEHLPTSPNHEITPSSLEVVSIDDFRSAKISEKAEAKVRRVKPKVPFGSSAHIGALTALSARLKGEFGKVSAGRWGVFTDGGEAPPRTPQIAENQRLFSKTGGKSESFGKTFSKFRPLNY